MNIVPRNAIKLTFDEIKLLALFDTGSDISAIRQDVYELYFRDDLLSTDKILVKGIGSNRVKTLGSIRKKVEIDGEEFDLLFYILPKQTMDFEVIVGNNLLKQAEVHLSEDEIVVHRIEEKFLMSIRVDESIVDDEINLTHIDDKKFRKLEKRTIGDDKPKKTEFTDTKMNIIQKDDEPIYQETRRFSQPEKEQEEKPLEENGLLERVRIARRIKMREKEDIVLAELIEKEVKKQFDEARENLRGEFHKQHLMKVEDKNRKNYNAKRSKAVFFKEGDLVSIRRTQFRAGLKVHKKFLGPYEVIKVKRNDRYDVVKIGNHEGPIRISTCSEYMKPWIQYESESDSQ